MLRTTDAALDALRADLEAAGFGVDVLADLLGPVATAAMAREQVLPATLVARGSAHPAAVLALAFMLGGGVSRAMLDAALPTLGTDGAVRLGLVRAAGASGSDEVRGLVDLRPVDAAAGGFWLAADLGEATTGRAVDPEHVLGLGGASRTLAELTVRSPVRRALDLGTGCGIQALNVAPFAGEVVATDVSRRALAFAGFNARLNGIDVDLRLGSMLEPVAGETFDLVVSNPPFVISPRGEREVLPAYTYRDGGRSGDDLVADLVRTVGGVLAPGGVAQLLGNWEVRRGEAWTDRVGRWLEDSGLDGWVIQRELADPAQYAETWLRDAGTAPERDRTVWGRGYRAWLEDFASRDVEAVGFGYITLHRPLRPAARPWHRLEEITGTVEPALGRTVEATVRAKDRLAAMTDAELLASPLRAAGDVTEERHHRPGEADPQVIVLRQGGGLARAVRADTVLAAVVGASDGDLTVGQVCGALGVLLDVDAAALGRDVLPSVRGLVLDGLLLLDR